ncbi:sigma 54-interacting transcriptional regulator [uncultured Croceicoccus sp.]|uniref:sigma-54 interaction domain-containing protein n=1 Tax=uncultured Croceicoccus sp. TaxID=1295329 RepID=UPI00260CB00E|nr:sigma 54-interacting transcriptional regulator [uncultured Croceicoccus sp.]
MLTARTGKNAEKNHNPLVRRVATVVESMPGTGTVTLCEAGEDLPARRRDDIVVVFERAAGNTAPAILRQGANRHLVRHADAQTETSLAAGIACARASGGPVCADPGSLALLVLAEKLAKSDIPVLIAGPTGTGKEVLSRFIHEHSDRAGKPFVAINCAAMPETMLEALLFGHRKGAFTGAAANGAEGLFQAADGGTLLLDEIAEMPLPLQAKLLRALQEGEILPLGATIPVKVDVRIVACANRDLPREVAEGRFREDLFYRLNVFPLNIPALRERVADIAPLAFALMLRHAHGDDLPWISDAAIAKLQAHSWPGNIRELENVMRRALLIGNGAIIGEEDICFDMAARPLAAPVATDTASISAQDIPVQEATMPEPAASSAVAPRLANIVQQSQARAIAQALQCNDGHRGQTARQLGISERTLRYRLADMRAAGLDLSRMAMGAGR